MRIDIIMYKNKVLYVLTYKLDEKIQFIKYTILMQ